jgi:hypothetical protein
MPILFGTAAYSFRALLNFLQQRRLINRQAELSFKLIDSYNGSPELLAKVDGLMDLSPGVLETPQSGSRPRPHPDLHSGRASSWPASASPSCSCSSSVPEAAQGFAVFGAHLPGDRIGLPALQPGRLLHGPPLGAPAHPSRPRPKPTTWHSEERDGSWPSPWRPPRWGPAGTLPFGRRVGAAHG